MPTLVYSPAVRVRVATNNHGIIDVSDDISSGSVTLQPGEGGGSSARLSLTNNRRKYDGIFTPNDRIVIQMKRITWVQVFAGYLDEVPYFSVYPRSVPLTASDTLKRLRYWLWDSGTPEAWTLLHMKGNFRQEAEEIDGGLRDRVLRLLTRVAKWEPEKIHIGYLPMELFDKVESLQKKLADQIHIDMSLLGSAGVSQGGSVLQGGSTSVEGDGPGTGELPNTSGRASWFGGPGGGAYGSMGLTGESGSNPRDPWYAAMRWPYVRSDPRSGAAVSYLSPENQANAINWWRNRKILVYSPKTNKAVVLRAADWGPNINSGRVIDMSRKALEDVLKIGTDQNVEIRFAPKGASLGPTTIQETHPAASKNGGGHKGNKGADNPSTTTGEDYQRPADAVPKVVPGASGLRFTDADNLEGNTYAARSFIKENWNPQYGIGGYAYRKIAGTNTLSDHALGLALDSMVAPPGSVAKGDNKAKGNGIAQWFTVNPRAFSTKYIIWMDRINTGSGWRSYGHPGGGGGNTLQHRDHVHISFNNTGQTKMGPLGGSWPGGDDSDFQGGTASGPGGASDGGSAGSSDSLINAFDWFGSPSADSQLFYGPRALMNDTAILDTVAMLMNASMRSFASAPNGDFIGWFPDYFGQYGTAAVMNIQDIELVGDGFTLEWSDARLITHQFVTGSPTGFGLGSEPGGPVMIEQQFMTMGVASVEYPEIMEALFNINLEDEKDKKKKDRGPQPVVPNFAQELADAKTVFERFGARVDNRSIPTITGPSPVEFWYALFLFQKNWAEQFSSTPKVTFMPELFPGMLMRFPSYKFQCYVNTVTHTFDFSEGGGFQTDVGVIAPSATDGSGLFGLPRGGH